MSIIRYHINPLLRRSRIPSLLLRSVCAALFVVSVCGNISGMERTRHLQADSIFYNEGIEGELPELNITAIKQQDRLRNEPVSGTVLGSGELRSSGVVAVKGLSEMVPNLYIPDYGSRITSSIYVRGIGARMDHPAVGLVIDNVAVLNKDAYDLDIPDMARVEVLRGPQSALYGRNTMGGLINVSTISPFRYQGWRLQVTVANGRQTKGSVGWYHKFNPRHAISVSLLANHQGGFRRNEYDNSLTERETSGSLRLKYQWRILPSLSLQNILSTSLLHQNGYAYEFTETGKIDYNDPCRYDRFTLSDGLTLMKFHDDFTAVSVTSLQYIDDDLLLDQDFLPQPYFTLNQRKHELAITQDLTVRSPDNNNNAYGWIAGLSGFWKKMHMEAPVTFKNTGISELIEKHRNDANPYFPISWNTRSFPLDSDFDVPTYGLAVYHESKLGLGDFKITAALRLEYERAVMHYHSYCSTGYGIYDSPDPDMVPSPDVIAGWPLVRKVRIDIDDRGDLKRDYLMLLPSLSLLWNISGGSSNIYANVSRGAKAGGFNTQMFSEVLQQRLMNIMGIGKPHDVNETVGYKPEHSWNYEIGAHLDFSSARLQVDLSAFYIDCRDQQLTMFPDGTTTGRMMTNAGETRSYGAEATLRWNATDRLDFNASYGFTDARFRKFSDGINDYAGKKLPYVPGNTLFIQGLYRQPLQGTWGSLEFDVSVSITGPIEWNEANTLRQNPYAQLAASVSWRKNGWELRLWGKNLTDTSFHTFYFKSMGHEFLQQGKPLQAGVTFSYEI